MPKTTTTTSESSTSMATTSDEVEVEATECEYADSLLEILDFEQAISIESWNNSSRSARSLLCLLHFVVFLLAQGIGSIEFLTILCKK